LPTVLAPSPKIESPVAHSSRKRNIARSALEVILFLIAGVLLLEFLFNLAGVGNEEYLDIEPKSGWTLMPERTIVFRKEGYSKTTSNSFGFRGAAYSKIKPPGVYRIAALGDSFTEGLQVDEENTFCNVLERELNKNAAPGRKFEVLNFGVSHYNLAQEYIRMKELAMDFHPDLVIMEARPNSIMMLGPTRESGLFNARPSSTLLPDGSLFIDRSLQQKWLGSKDGRRVKSSSWLRRNSRIWGIIGKSWEQVNEDFPREFKRTISSWTNNNSVVSTKSKDPGENASTSQPDEATKYLGRLAIKIFQESQEECRKNNCQFCVLYMMMQPWFYRPQEHLIYQEAAKTVPFDLIDLNAKDVRKNTPPDYFLDYHPSRRGHQFIAEQIQSYMKAKGIVRSTDSR